MSVDFTVFNVYMKETRKATEAPMLRSKDEALALLDVVFEDLDRENFIVVLLGPMSELIGISTVSVGSTTCTVIHPREVFKPAILGNASAIILAHNHPSGDMTPSIADCEVTEILRNAGLVLNIPVIDHIIWTTQGHFSFAENGWEGIAQEQKVEVPFPTIEWDTSLLVQ